MSPQITDGGAGFGITTISVSTQYQQSMSACTRNRRYWGVCGAGGGDTKTAMVFKVLGVGTG